MMRRYDPMKSPDPEEWLALGEMERIILVEDYHRRKRIRMPSIKAHACFHVVVETQVAEGDELPTKRKLQQLMDEGLNRHQAIHAIASVVVSQVYRGLKTPSEYPDLRGSYLADLEELTAEKWLKSAEE